MSFAEVKNDQIQSDISG